MMQRKSTGAFSAAPPPPNGGTLSTSLIAPDQPSVKESTNPSDADLFAQQGIAPDGEVDPLTPLESAPDDSLDGFNLGGHLHSLWTVAEAERSGIESRWLDDLRQYKGIYPAAVRAKLTGGKANAFIGITKTKIQAIDARIMDLNFPTSEETNWNIKPSPEPELPNELVNIKAQEWVAKNQRPPTPEDIAMIVMEDAKNRSSLMGARIKDQLVEARYRDKMRKVVHSGNLYGTGVLKGPLVDYKDARSWVLTADGGWTMQTEQKMLPYIEATSVWDIYPDMSAVEPEDLRFVFQRHVMPRSELVELSNRDDFESEIIMEHIRTNRNGTAIYKTYEQELRTLDSERFNPDERTDFMSERKKRYEVIEFWGSIDAEDIIDSGYSLPDELMGLELLANVWMLRDKVIKFEIAEVQSIGIPYYWYYYNKDETCIFGEGVPVVMRDTQKLFNAAVRALCDNTAGSAGPVYEVNEDMISPGQNLDNIGPWTTVYRGGRGIEAQHPAIRVHTIQSNAQLYIQLINLFSTLADESSAIPKYLHGSAQGMGGGAGRTMGGMSMMLGQSVTVVKEQVRCLDDYVVKRFIRNMYYWNMELGEGDEYKGDFEVNAEGSASLIAKEVRAEKLISYLQSTANPLDASMVNRPYLHREIVKCLDLGDQAVKSDETIKTEQESGQQQQQQMMMMQQAIQELQSYVKQLEQRVKASHIDGLDEGGLGEFDDPMQAAQREVVVNAATQR